MMGAGMGITKGRSQGGPFSYEFQVVNLTFHNSDRTGRFQVENKEGPLA
jgi:hypothetical protein